MKSDRLLVFLLRLGAFLCLAGWTWTHLYWEGPYGVLLWQDSTYELADRFGISWDEFVGTGANDGVVQTWIGRIGWLYLGCTLLTVLAGRFRNRWVDRTICAGLVFASLLLVVLGYAKYVSSERQLAMFIEHGGQMLIPTLLTMAVTFGPRHRVTVITAFIAFIMTFAGHGSFAIGLWPTPAKFYAMTSVILGVEYETANVLLRAAGVLDFVVCVGIFIPPLRRPSALYAAAWGLLTAMARPVAGMSLSLNYWGADQFLHEAVLRAPHFLIPLYLFFLWQPQKDPLTNTPSDSETAGESPS
ncbi:MAG: hypothetical protein AAGG48_13270 [Planctomycetota bacterium]